MTRSLILTATVLSLTLTTACDNAAEEQTKATAAQVEANAKIEATRKEAEAKMKSTQADADKKIADAQAGFMKMREDYRHSATNDMTALDKKIAELDAKVTTVTGKAKTDLEANLRVIHADRDRFGVDFKALETANASTWDGAKASLDKQWAAVKELVDKA